MALLNRLDILSQSLRPGSCAVRNVPYYLVNIPTMESYGYLQPRRSARELPKQIRVVTSLGTFVEMSGLRGCEFRGARNRCRHVLATPSSSSCDRQAWINWCRAPSPEGHVSSDSWSRFIDSSRDMVVVEAKTHEDLDNVGVFESSVFQMASSARRYAMQERREYSRELQSVSRGR